MTVETAQTIVTACAAFFLVAFAAMILDYLFSDPERDYELISSPDPDMLKALMAVDADCELLGTVRADSIDLVRDALRKAGVAA